MTLIVDFHELVRGALTEGSVLQFGEGPHPVKVLVDPQPSAVSAFMDNECFRDVARGYLVDDKVYIWDAYDCTHADMAKLLGKKYPTCVPFMASKSFEALDGENDWDSFSYFNSGHYYLICYKDDVLRRNPRFERLFPNLRAIDVRQQEWFADDYRVNEFGDFLDYDKTGYAAKLVRDSQT